MDQLFLIARIADQIVALPASEIGSVVEITQIAPVPRVAPHVAGLSALRSRVLTVIDTRASLALGTVARTDCMTAIVVECDGHGYALLVDAIEDVIKAPPPEPCPATLDPAWRPVALGVIRRDDEVILLVATGALVAGPETLAA